MYSISKTAAAVSLVAEGGLNILSAQYECVKSVSDATVLSCYRIRRKSRRNESHQI